MPNYQAGDLYKFFESLGAEEVEAIKKELIACSFGGGVLAEDYLTTLSMRNERAACIVTPSSNVSSVAYGNDSFYEAA